MDPINIGDVDKFKDIRIATTFHAEAGLIFPEDGVDNFNTRLLLLFKIL
jgi:hypothetical protein